MALLMKAKSARKEKDEPRCATARPNALTCTDFENPIRQVMDYYAGFRRNMPGMKLALEKLELIASRREKVKAKNLHELMRLHEAFDLLELCRMHLDACLQRRESGRGMYKLADYPDLDPALDQGAGGSAGKRIARVFLAGKAAL